jgi:alpha-methylacyl-CoA racemase
VAELAAADTCVTPVLSVAELTDDAQYAARHAFVDAVSTPTSAEGGAGTPTRFRQVAPVLAGMEAPDGPVVIGDPLRSDTDRLLTDAGLTPGQVADLRERGVVA